MNVNNLNTHLNNLSTACVHLNAEERGAIFANLIKVKNNENFKDVLFWGKINALKKDYYIAVGLKYDSFDFLSKKFFFSGPDFNFAELPAISADQILRAQSIRSPLSGEADTILDAGQPAENAEGEEGGEGNPNALRELHRLAYLVQEIERDTAVVPAGAFMYTAAHTVAPSRTFQGLTLAEADKIGSYLHLRPAQNEARRAVAQRDDAVYSPHFLDTIADDQPNGAWSLVWDAAHAVVLVRSLVWPGYVFYHVPETNFFGSLYVGDAQKCVDLPFLLP